MPSPALKNKSFFITATDTGVGKTFVSCLLAEALRRRGARVAVLKPYAAGGWEDTDTLIAASGRSSSRAEVTPVFFRKPLAPAARFLSPKAPPDGGRRQVAGEIRSLSAAIRSLRKTAEHVIVEGIGGALCPLGGGFTLADAAADWSLPAWVVARPGLGTLHHTLSTVEALRRRKIPVERIVVSGYTGASEAERTNPLLLSRLTTLPVTLLPKIKNAAHRRRLVQQWAALFSL